jgi:hypothetical protein
MQHHSSPQQSATILNIDIKMEGVSNLPNNLHKADVERTINELKRMNTEIEQAIKQVCLPFPLCTHEP